MYSNEPRTALRFITTKPEYSRMFMELDLYTPKEQLMPFQIHRQPRGESITVFKAVRVDEAYEMDLFAYVDTNEEPYILSFVGKDMIIYKADPLAVDLNPGRFYLVISDGIETWYSMSILRIACWTMQPVAPIPFDDGMGTMEDIIID